VIVGGLMVGMLINIFLLPTLYVWAAGDRDVLPALDKDFVEGES
jgi:cobalt-zinc-cadmium resistance protein CzcA